MQLLTEGFFFSFLLLSFLQADIHVEANNKMNNQYFDVKTPDNISEADLSSSDKKRYRITRAW